MGHKLLYIAPEFAPMNSTGVHRSVKFVKYLSKLGYDITVLTLSDEDKERIFNRPIEPELLNELVDSCNIIEVSTNFKSGGRRTTKFQDYLRIFFSVSDGIGRPFLNASKAYIKSQLDRDQFDAVIISLPPFSGYVFVDYIRENSDIPVIVDMRDAWSTWSTSPWPTKMHFLIARSKERRLFQQADRVVTVTVELRDIFQSIHPMISELKFVVIPNGIDFNLEGIPSPIEYRYIEGSTVKIGYIGSFYYNPKYEEVMSKPWYYRKVNHWFLYKALQEDWSYRSPKYFFEILSRMIRIYPECKDKVEFHFIGRIPYWYSQMVSRYELEDIVVNHGFQEYSNVMKIQQEFDFFLATSEQVKEGKHYCLPSKLFDYIKAGKPIIGCLTEGTQLVFLDTYGGAEFLNLENLDDSARQLFNLIFGSRIFDVDLDYLHKYRREELSRELHRTIQEAI